MVQHWPKKTYYLTLHGSVFDASGTVNYDCIFTNSINSLLTIVEPMLQNVSNTLLYNDIGPNRHKQIQMKLEVTFYTL